MLMSLYERLFRKDDLKMQEEKFSLAKQVENKNDRDYIYNHIKDTRIKIDEQKEEDAITLIESKRLMGWDYATTSILGVLFEEANVVRGNVELWKTKPYPHAWLEININGLVYCFDPCFNIICLRCDFNKIFKPKIDARIPVKNIKEKIIKYFNNYSETRMFIIGTNDINAEFYKFLAIITADVDNDIIKNLRVKYYYN